jgi:putative membrane protein
MSVPLALVGGMTLGYVALAARQRTSRRGWSGWRIGAFVAGAAILALGLSPDVLPFPRGDFRKHMLEHLAIGMLAPIGLVLGAPLKLLLRSVSAAWGRRIAAALDTRTFRTLANPFVALVLDLGGMAALYFTPLYSAMMMHPALHYLVHFHFLAAGFLYSWVIAGHEATRDRPSVPMRLAVLGVAVVIHSVLSQLLYANIGIAIAAPAAQLQQGAELMYYGGDLSEILLAFALVTSWRPRHAGSRLVAGVDGPDIWARCSDLFPHG